MCTFFSKEENLDNKLFITGEIGDQIMGHFYNTTSFPQLNDEEYMLGKDVFSFVKFIEDEQLRKDWEDFSHIMYEVRQSEIETVFDMLWWANFTTKYTFCIHRLSLWVEKQLPTTSFYNTKQFQIWSMNHNWKLKCNGNWWTHYKMPLKKESKSYSNHLSPKLSLRYSPNATKNNSNLNKKLT